MKDKKLMWIVLIFILLAVVAYFMFFNKSSTGDAICGNYCCEYKWVNGTNSTNATSYQMCVKTCNSCRSNIIQRIVTNPTGQAICGDYCCKYKWVNGTNSTNATNSQQCVQTCNSCNNRISNNPKVNQM